MGFFGKKGKEESIEIKKNWYADRYQTVIVQRNFLVLVTAASLVGIIFSILSVVKITTSKTIEPFVIEIEEKTGITNVIRPLAQEKYAYDETLRRYFLNLYLNAREAYNAALYDNSYKIVRLYSTSQVFNEYKQDVNASNPKSPLRMSPNTQRYLKIKSLTFLQAVKDQDKSVFTAQIRFKTDDNGANVQHRVATVNFSYSDMVLNDEDRLVNPLAFQVVSYRVDDEIIQ